MQRIRLLTFTGPNLQSSQNMYYCNVQDGNFYNYNFFGSGNTITGGYFQNCFFTNYIISGVIFNIVT